MSEPGRPSPGGSAGPVGERYRLTSLIAAGGMGEVWRGTDTLLDRDVAIKLLHGNLAGDEVFRERFRAEARATAAVVSDAVVDVYDYGEQTGSTGDCVAYLVMELVEGESLEARLRRDGAMQPAAVRDLLRQVGAGLAAAHARGLVHRDIKPANLLLSAQGRRVTVVDFGIARAADAAALTATGTIIGTATYLSPEQVRGAVATSASDVYSLGVVAYRCLAGAAPFSGDGEIATALARVQSDPPPLPPSVPPDLRHLVHAMLARHPADRPSAADVAASASAPAGEPTRVLTAVAPRRRLPWVAAAAAAIIGVAVVLPVVLASGPSGAASATTRPTPSASATKHHPASSHAARRTHRPVTAVTRHRAVTRPAATHPPHHSHPPKPGPGHGGPAGPGGPHHVPPGHAKHPGHG